MKYYVALTVLALLLLAGMLMLGGCAGSLSQMSDDWCAAHPKAPDTRCWGRA